MTCVEMLGRKLFSFSLQGVDEIGSYTYGIVGAFGFAYALITRSHTRVDFLLSRFPVRMRALLNLLAMLSLAALSLLCLWRGCARGGRKHRARQHRRDAAGHADVDPAIDLARRLSDVRAGRRLGRARRAAAVPARRTQELNARFGPQTLEEEIEAETDIHLKTATRHDGRPNRPPEPHHDRPVRNPDRPGADARPDVPRLPRRDDDAGRRPASAR